MSSKKAQRIAALSIRKEDTLLHALRQMEDEKSRLLMVMTEKEFSGMLSTGDIQRALIHGAGLDSAAGHVMRQRITIAFRGEPFNEIREKMLAGRIEFMPVINADNTIHDVIFWDELFPANESNTGHLPEGMEALIIAGGKGTRLAPVTSVIPKPLLLLGEKPVIQHIVESLYRQGIKKFRIAIHHQADLIRSFFESLEPLPYKVAFTEEQYPLGTAGSIFIAEAFEDVFLVSNADILIDYPLFKVFDFHRKGGFDITILAANIETEIPYGIVDVDDEGRLTRLAEKPRIQHSAITGAYILNPAIQQLFKAGEVVDFNQLLEKAVERGLNMGVYSIPSSCWTDMGNWKDYREAQKRFLS